MPVRYQITLKRENGPDKELNGEFSDDEHIMLLKYLKQYEQLDESKPLREGFPSKFSMHYDRQTGLKVTTSLPDSDTVSILLHRLRPFILNNEPASFLKICSLIGRRIEDEYIRGLLRKERERYNGRDLQRLIKIGLNDTTLNTEKILYDWLNAHEYHRDPDKQQAVDELFQMLPGDLFRGILISMLVEKVYAIIHVAYLIAVLLGKTQQLKFSVNLEPPLYRDETSS